MSKNRIDSVAVPRASHGVGPDSCAEMLMPAMTLVFRRRAMPPYSFGDEPERLELEQDVVAEEPVDVESGSAGVELYLRAELHRVRRDREVRFDLQARVVVRQQADADPRHVAEAVRQRRDGRDVAEVGVEPADAERECLLLAPRHEERQAPGDRVDQQTRFVQVGAEEQVARDRNPARR